MKARWTRTSSTYFCPGRVNDNFAEYSILGWHLFSFRAWNTRFHTFLAYRVCLEVWDDLYVVPFGCKLVFFSCSFRYLFLSNLAILTVIWHRDVFLWSGLLGVQNALYAWVSISFPRLGIILSMSPLSRFPMPLVCVELLLLHYGFLGLAFWSCLRVLEVCNNSFSFFLCHWVQCFLDFIFHPWHSFF